MKPTPTTNTVIELLEEATLTEAGSLLPTTDLLEVTSWDSMGIVIFIGLVQENYDITLSVADIRASPTIEGLLDLICKRLEPTP